MQLRAELRELLKAIRVPQAPAPRPGLLFGHTRGAPLPFPLGHPRAYPTFGGSAAVFQAAAVLDLPRGARVLVPAYNCGQEVEPLLRHGLALDFYPVGRNLEVDRHELERRVRPETRAILATHFFGFPQPVHELRRLCDRVGLYLIEDCAHGLFSRAEGVELGRVGDVAIFSPRKTLPLPHGGLVVVNNPRLPAPESPLPAPLPSVLGKLLDGWRSCIAISASGRLSPASSLALAGLSPLVMARRVARSLPVWSAGAWYDPDRPSLDHATEFLRWGASPLTRRILERLDLRDIAERRRRNYERLIEALRGLEHLRPLREALDPGSCPLYLPLLCDEGIERKELRERLKSRGVMTVNWWGEFHPAVPWDDYPDAAYLKRHVLAIPVHQELSSAQIEALAVALRRA